MQLKRIFKKLLTKLPFDSFVGYVRRIYLTKAVLADEKGHEADVEFLNKIIRAGDVVVDIGANIGLYTKHLSRLTGESGKVLAFEPISAESAGFTVCNKKNSFSKCPMFSWCCFITGR